MIDRKHRKAGVAVVLAGLAASFGATAAEPDGTHAPAPEVCVTATIGGDPNLYLNCLNQDLAHEAARQADRQAQLQAVVGNSLPSSPTGQGLFNETATHERLGTSFGHSVYPQRPPVQFTNPLVH